MTSPCAEINHACSVLQSCSRQAEYALEQQRSNNLLEAARTESGQLACSLAQAEAISTASEARLKDLHSQHHKVHPAVVCGWTAVAACLTCPQSTVACAQSLCCSCMPVSRPQECAALLSRHVACFLSVNSLHADLEETSKLHPSRHALRCCASPSTVSASTRLSIGLRVLLSDTAHTVPIPFSIVCKLYMLLSKTPVSCYSVEGKV